MKLSEFDYPFPPELIASHPAEPRDASRLLVYDRQSQALHHRTFRDIAEFLKTGDLLVLNDTRVIPARFFGVNNWQREYEIFLLEPLEPTRHQWKCLARPGKKIESLERLTFSGGRIGTVLRRGEASFEIHFSELPMEENSRWLEESGLSPLPPYIRRAPEESDKRNYQTVYAKNPGSVAAPTAGLHFTDSLIAQLKNRGIEFASVTLHVSYGTFSPIREEQIENHRMHEESYHIPESTQRAIENARQRGSRIIPVGTTSFRTLESMARFGTEGRTDLFIRPGHSFAFPDGLITNFHQPKSSLLVLVASLVGIDALSSIYRQAIENRYRLFSYGDAMLVV